MNKLITVIDFNPDGICLASGYVDNQKNIQVVATTKGEILKFTNNFIDEEFATSSLTSLLKAHQIKLPAGVDSFYVTLLPSFNCYINLKQHVESFLRTNVVTYNDYENLIGASSNHFRENINFKDLAPLFVDPISYSANFADYDTFPMGIKATKLGMNYNEYFLPISLIQFYQRIISNCEIMPSQYYFANFTSYNFMKNNFKKEDENKYFFCSIGESFSNIYFVYKNDIYASYTLSFGVNDIILKTSQKLNVSFERMKELLNMFGFENNADFKYKTSIEGLSLADINSALMETLASYKGLFNEFLTQYNSNNDLKLMCYGNCIKIKNFTTALSTVLGIADCFEIKNRVIGLRDNSFLSSLGAISAYNNILRLKEENISNQNINKSSYISRE